MIIINSIGFFEKSECLRWMEQEKKNPDSKYKNCELRYRYDKLGNPHHFIDIYGLPESIQIFKNEISRKEIEKAENVLIDNGIDEDEAETVLQALGYVLLDVELYPGA